MPVPDPQKTITFKSLVEQYETAAREQCNYLGITEQYWRLIAESWAEVDIDTIGCIMATGISAEEALRTLLQPVPNESK